MRQGRSAGITVIVYIGIPDLTGFFQSIVVISIGVVRDIPAGLTASLLADSRVPKAIVVSIGIISGQATFIRGAVAVVVNTITNLGCTRVNRIIVVLAIAARSR